MVEKSTRDDIATLIEMVRGRLISVLVVVIVALGIVSEAFSIYNGYLQVKINQAELPKRRAESCSARQKARIDFMPGRAEDRPDTDEIRQLELECNPWARAKLKAGKANGPNAEVTRDDVLAAMSEMEDVCKFDKNETPEARLKEVDVCNAAIKRSEIAYQHYSTWQHVWGADLSPGWPFIKWGIISLLIIIIGSNLYSRYKREE